MVRVAIFVNGMLETEGGCNDNIGRPIAGKEFNIRFGRKADPNNETLFNVSVESEFIIVRFFFVYDTQLGVRAVF